MIQTFTMRKQTPEVEGDWLYKDENDIRMFSQEVYLPDGAALWAECTNEEKEQWETLNKQKDENKFVDEIEENE